MNPPVECGDRVVLDLKDGTRIEGLVNDADETTIYLAEGMGDVKIADISEITQLGPLGY